MKTVLITGASGYLGQHYKNYYMDAGWKIITIGRRKDDDIFWDANIKRTISLSDFSTPVDRIVHCAAVNETMIKESSETTFDVNVTFTRTLCDLALELKIKQFIYVSTFHVYGASSGPFGPDTICNPLNDYGLTHYLSEEILRNTLRGEQISILCLRPTNIYGVPPHLSLFDRWSLVPFNFVKAAMEDKRIKLVTSGLQERNFVDVRNVIKAKPKKPGFEIRDIYGKDTLSIIDFAKLVARVIKEVHQIDVSIELPHTTNKSQKKISSLEFHDHKNLYPYEGNIEEFIKEFSHQLKAS